MTERNAGLWLLLVLLAITGLLFGGCARWERDPLSVYSADPKAFTFWIMPF